MVSTIERPQNVPAACLPLSSVTGQDVAHVGGKAASLGEMLSIGAPVPPGFVITTAAYRAFILERRLDQVLEGLLDGVDVHDSRKLNRVAAQIKELILSRSMSPEIEEAIRGGYERLGGGPVAVRSSGTAEDMPDASFAGQHRTLLNVEGSANVVRGVLACWASLFEARAIFYREENSIPHTDVAMAVTIQRMVPADASGVMLTSGPSTEDDAILIEAVYGLGEPLVSGELSPDTDTVNRQGLKVTGRQVAVQPWMMCRDPHGDALEEGSKRAGVPLELQTRQKLGDTNISLLADLGLRLERHYGRPQDIEWAFAGGHPYILQIQTDYGSSRRAGPNQWRR